MMPLSYNGLGFTAILIMITVLSISEAVKYVRGRVNNHHHKHEH